MASTSPCRYCGSTISSSEEKCPNCGAPNEGYVAETERRIFLPQTIEELKEYCAERGMPLLRMRFFIGEDYREPKAFGIYKEGSSFVVYKNKANGERAIRYRGPDEKHAVTELFMKLLEECRSRGIYPDGQVPERSGGGSRTGAGKKRSMLPAMIVIILCILFAAVMGIMSKIEHRKDGYYGAGDGTVYYHYGDDWYYTYDLSDSGYWYPTYEFPYEDYEEYSLGNSWDADWGVSDFKESGTYESLTESHSSSSSDYDSWDSSDTDWDSDW